MTTNKEDIRRWLDLYMEGKTKAVKLEIVQPADNSSGLFEWEVK